MKISVNILHAATLMAYSGLAAASSSSLRGGSDTEGRRLPQSDECLIHAVALLEIEPGSR